MKFYSIFLKSYQNACITYLLYPGYPAKETSAQYHSKIRNWRKRSVWVIIFTLFISCILTDIDHIKTKGSKTENHVGILTEIYARIRNKTKVIDNNTEKTKNDRWKKLDDWLEDRIWIQWLYESLMRFGEWFHPFSKGGGEGRRDYRFGNCAWWADAEEGQIREGLWMELRPKDSV